MTLVRSLTSVGGLTLVSRALALVRDTLQASYVGAGFASDAFFVAFRLPNMFRALFAEGAFSAAFIPLFNRKVGGSGDVSAGLRFAERALAVLFPVLLVFTLFMLAALGAVGRLQGPDARPIRLRRDLVADHDSLFVADLACFAAGRDPELTRPVLGERGGADPAEHRDDRGTRFLPRRERI